MAQQTTDRELRRVLRDNVRERQALEGKNEEMMREIERLKGQLRDMQGQETQLKEPDMRNEYRLEGNIPDIENQSVLSDVGTIDEFLRDSLSIREGVRELEEKEELREMEENIELHKQESLREDHRLRAPPVNHQEDHISQTLRRNENQLENRRSRAPPMKESFHEDQPSRNEISFRVETTKELGDNSTWDPSLGCVIRDSQLSDTYLKTPMLKPHDTGLIGATGGPPDKDMDTRLDKVRRDQEEIRSQHSYYKTRSQKLIQKRSDEERRKLLLLGNEKRLRMEIEKKQNAEKELMERIQQIEMQEQELNRERAENDRIEREMLEYMKQDEEMSRRLQLLREKEKLLIQTSEIRGGERPIEVKSELPHAMSGKAEELPSSTPYRGRESQYGRVPDYYMAGESQYDRVPDYHRVREDPYERGLNPQRAGYSIGETKPDFGNRVTYEEEPRPVIARNSIKQTATDTQDNAVSKVEESPENKFPLFKMGLPKVPNFNGKQFEQWKTEVNCLLMAKIYPDYAIAQSVRNSLKDDTRQILLTLKPTSSTKDILKKVEEVYGNVKTGDNIVHEFYSVKQKEKETVSAWGIRLETLFQQAVEKGEIEEKKRDKKLKERFWRGLNSEKLKNATRVSYESDDSFETLRKKARREEEEAELEKKTDQVTMNQQVDSSEKDKTLKELLQRIKGIETELENMRKRNEDQSFGNRWHSRGSFRGRHRGYSRRPNYGRQQDHTAQRHQQDQQDQTARGHQQDRQQERQREPQQSSEKKSGSLN